MNASPTRFYEFGHFRIDSVKRLLLRNREPITLKSKCFDLLLVLVEARGQVLDKGELMSLVWPDTIFEWLEKAYRERDWGLAWIKCSPSYDGVRTDPRFTKLLKRMNLLP